eukprot:scaffold54196_cov40-Prasinocladus_malaysianus.AAC.1
MDGLDISTHVTLSHGSHYQFGLAANDHFDLQSVMLANMCRVVIGHLSQLAIEYAHSGLNELLVLRKVVVAANE